MSEVQDGGRRNGAPNDIQFRIDLNWSKSLSYEILNK